jgi:hypothetical protein
MNGEQPTEGLMLVRGTGGAPARAALGCCRKASTSRQRGRRSRLNLEIGGQERTQLVQYQFT